MNLFLDAAPQATEFTISNVILLLGSLGAISGLVIYLLQRGMTNKAASVNIIKTNKEIEQLEQNVESKYALQVKRWLDDLHEIKEKHDSEIDKKDEEIEKLYKQHLEIIKELSEHKLRLIQSTKASRRLFINMNIPYWEADKSGKLIYANGAWLTLFGLESEDALGEGWTNAIAEEDRAALLVSWYSKVVDEADGAITFHVLNPLTKESTPVKSLYAVLFDSDGQVYKIIGTTINLTS